MVLSLNSPFTEAQKKKIASLLSQALIPSPSPKKEKGEKLSFQRRGISLKIKELVRSAPHHPGKREWLSEHLFKTMHNCIPGFIRNPNWQPGLIPHISIQPAELNSVTRKNDPTIIYVAGYFSRKLSERGRNDFNYLAHHLVSHGIDFAGGDFESPGAAIQNIQALNRDLLREIFRQS